ncbi:MAG: hypothetical protein ACOCU2_00140 [Bacillota bacterium]
MKKLFALLAFLTLSFTLIGCDIIEEEIERAESLELEDYTVDIPSQNILLKITSNADEQVVDRVIINDESYDLVSQGDDWYLLEDIPIAKTYDIGDVYYITSVGATVPYDVDFTITVDEALDHLPDTSQIVLSDTETIDGYTFTLNDDDLDITSEATHAVEEIDDWVWLVLEEEVPQFAVIYHNEQYIIIIAPDDTADYLDD